MNQFWRKVWEMCLLKAGPQDIPASSYLMLVALSAYFFISVLLAMVNLGVGASFGAAVVDVVLLLFVTYVMMWVKVTMNRWHQLVTSMAAVCAMVGAIALPAAGLQVILGPENSLTVIPVLVLIGLMVWNLVVVANLFKHALDASVFFAAFLAGFYMYLSLKVMSVLFFQAD